MIKLLTPGLKYYHNQNTDDQGWDTINNIDDTHDDHIKLAAIIAAETAQHRTNCCI